MTSKRSLAMVALVVAAGICGCATQEAWAGQTPRTVSAKRPPPPNRRAESRPRLPETTPAQVARRFEEVGAAAPDPVSRPGYEPAPYVAFSLRVARAKIESAPADEDYRPRLPEAYYLAGINRIRGAVYDREHDDLILVGAREADRPPLTLDDLAVALRSRFVHGEWPLVSIDPTPETKQTDMQRVRYEGGIEDTRFGLDMFDADLRLKTIGMNLLDSGVPDLKTYWSLSIDRIKEASTHKQFNINARFWFYPASPSVALREDVVAIKGLKVSVFTEVLSAVLDGEPVKDLTTFRDPTGDEFARQVSEHYTALGRVHRSIGRLAGLLELVALAHALEEMAKSPDLTYWLKQYGIKADTTPKQQKVLRRRSDYILPEAQGYVEASGGVHLTALALRLKAGDVSALRDAVLKTRPTDDALLWTFIVADWIIPTSPGMVELQDLGTLFAHALFLQNNKRYSDAITLYDRIIELKPDDAEAYTNRGVAYAHKGDYEQALLDYQHALELRPKDDPTYVNRGSAYGKMGQREAALRDFETAIRLNPTNAFAYTNRGVMLSRLGQRAKGIADHNRAIELDPRLALAYANRAAGYAEQGVYQRAMDDCDTAIKLNPRCVEAYVNRAALFAMRHDAERAVRDFDKVCKLRPLLPIVHYNRGVFHHSQGLYEKALADFNRTIELDAGYAAAYFNKAETCERLGRHQEARHAYERFIALNPPGYETFVTRAKHRVTELRASQP